MRTVLTAVLVSMLASGSAAAGECQAGHMALVGSGKTFKVAETSRTQVRFSGLGAERSIFRGSMSGKPYIVDIQGSQGSSTGFFSYPGWEPEKTALNPNWGVKPTGWVSGAQVMIDTGPLKGNWQTICR